MKKAEKGTDWAETLPCRERRASWKRRRWPRLMTPLSQAVKRCWHNAR